MAKQVIVLTLTLTFNFNVDFGSIPTKTRQNVGRRKYSLYQTEKIRLKQSKLCVNFIVSVRTSPVGKLFAIIYLLPLANLPYFSFPALDYLAQIATHLRKAHMHSQTDEEKENLKNIVAKVLVLFSNNEMMERKFSFILKKTRLSHSYFLRPKDVFASILTLTSRNAILRGIHAEIESSLN